MLIRFGNWIFHYRNVLFPIFYAALFLPSSKLTNDPGIALLAGSIFIVLGMAIRSITIGLVYIVRGGKNRQIYAEKLVTGGIYSVCRNPMYLGNILLILGFGIFANSMLFTFLFFPLFVFIYIAIIRAEENFLLGRFGEEFTFYKNNVRSLIPSLVQIKSAFSGHQFDWKKVIRKEYNSLFIYLSGMLMLSFYNHLLELNVFIGLFIILIVIYFIIKYLKSKRKLDSRLVYENH